MSARAISHEVATKSAASVNCFVYHAAAFTGADPTEVRCMLNLADGGTIGVRLTAQQARELANKLNACATVAERGGAP